VNREENDCGQSTDHGYLNDAQRFDAGMPSTYQTQRSYYADRAYHASKRQQDLGQRFACDNEICNPLCEKNQAEQQVEKEEPETDEYLYIEQPLKLGTHSERP